MNYHQLSYNLRMFVIVVISLLLLACEARYASIKPASLDQAKVNIKKGTKLKIITVDGRFQTVNVVSVNNGVIYGEKTRVSISDIAIVESRSLRGTGVEFIRVGAAGVAGVIVIRVLSNVITTVIFGVPVF